MMVNYITSINNMDSTKEGLMLFINALDHMPDVTMLVGEYIYGEIKQKTHQNMCFLTIEAFGSGKILHNFVMAKTYTMYGIKNQIKGDIELYLGQTSNKLHDSAQLGDLEDTKNHPQDKNQNIRVTLMVKHNTSDDSYLEKIQTTHDSWTIHTTNNAVKFKYIKSVKYLCENGCRRDIFTVAQAVINNDLECLKCLFEHNFPYNDSIYANAVYYNSVECLTYLMKMGVPLTSKPCSEAAKTNNLKMLIFLRKNECPWDIYTCINASANGHFDILRYARENDDIPAPWDKQVCTKAAKFGRLNCLKYAIKNGCPHDKQRCLEIARDYKQTEIVEYLNSI
jgi:hypothetical protein